MKDAIVEFLRNPDIRSWTMIVMPISMVLGCFPLPRLLRVPFAAIFVTVLALQIAGLWFDLNGKNSVLSYVLLLFVGPFFLWGLGKFLREAWRGPWLGRRSVKTQTQSG